MSSPEIVTDEQAKWKALVSEFTKKKICAYSPGEREYELSCATSNLLYRFTRPHFVVQPGNWAEVLLVVDRTYGLGLHGKLTVKCGGHSYTGFSTVDQGILVDLKRMTEAEIIFKDKKPDVAVIQAGARWGDVYRTLLRTDCRGYVVNGGRCPSVGVGGFILGGGLGPFGRTLGMGSDTMIGATIITLQDGKAVKLEVDKDNNKELFWALRGGGVSAFGIVTEFRMKVCKLSNSDVDNGVVACRYTWYPDQKWKDIKPEEKESREAKKKEEDQKLHATMTRFYEADWPNEMTIDSNWMLDMERDKGKLGIRFTLYFDGTQENCHELLNLHIIDPTLKEALIDRTLPEPTTRFLHETLFLMWEEEARLALPQITENSYQLWCSFVFERDAEILKEATRRGKEQQDRFEEQFKNDKASLWVTFIHSGGKVPEIGKTESSAYPWRTGVFHCSVLVKWGEKWLEQRARDAILTIKAELGALSLKHKKEDKEQDQDRDKEQDEEQCASYVNFSDATLAVQGDPFRAYYGSNAAKLQDLKQRMDPKNHFQWPWMTDTQKWRVLHGKYKPTVAEPAALAKVWTDSIATHDWDTFQIPLPTYTELYAPSYLNV